MRNLASTLTGLLFAAGGLGIAAGIGRNRAYWPLETGLAAVVLLVAGLVVVLWPRRRRVAAVVALVFAVQVAGRATVAVQDWFEAVGAGWVRLSQRELATAVGIAAAMATVATVVACAAVGLLWREPARGWMVWLSPRRPVIAAAGLVVAAAPAVMVVLAGAGRATEAGTIALSYGLPWAVALGVAGWLGPRAARAAGGALLVSIAVSLVGLAVA